MVCFSHSLNAFLFLEQKGAGCNERNYHWGCHNRTVGIFFPLLLCPCWGAGRSVDGRNGMEGQAGCRKKKRISSVFRRINQETAPDAISGTTERKPAQKNNAIICSRKRGWKRNLGIVVIVLMADILHVSGTAC